MTYQTTERIEAAAEVLLDRRNGWSRSGAEKTATEMLDAADEADGITFRVMRPEYVEVEGYVWCDTRGVPVSSRSTHVHLVPCPGPHRKLFTEADQHHFVTKCESCGEVE